MRRILVPLDGSKLAEKALEVAADLARRHDGELELLTVIDTVVANGFNQFASVEHIPITRAVEAYMESTAAAWKDIPVVDSHVVMAPSPAATIVGFAEEGGFDAIVMASHGRSGLGRWLLGSTAEKVVRSSNVPILVVPVR